MTDRVRNVLVGVFAAGCGVYALASEQMRLVASAAAAALAAVLVVAVFTRR